MRDSVGIVPLAARWRKASIVMGLACTFRVCWANNVCVLTMSQTEAGVGRRIHWWGWRRWDGSYKTSADSRCINC